MRKYASKKWEEKGAMTPRVKVLPKKNKKTNGSNGVITALLVSRSDFSNLLDLQNLLNYLMENLTTLFSTIEFSEENLQNIKMCLEHTKKLKPSQLQIPDEELKNMIENFIEEFNSFFSEIEGVKIEEINKNISIYGKVTELQWHALCLSEEIKRYIFNKNIID